MQQQTDKEEPPENKGAISLLIRVIIFIALIFFGIYLMRRGGYVSIAILVIGAGLSMIVYEIIRVAEAREKQRKEAEEDKQREE